ncbi:MAG: ABC transporter permease [Alicyclobacillus sp.]|nr:ABC transporter permease [Alicyclobacillus sp.]
MIEFFRAHGQDIANATLIHLELVSISLGIALIIAIPVAIACLNHERIANIVIRVAGIIMTVPSVAMFGLLIPILSLVGHGIGAFPAIVSLALYAQLPLIQNIYTGLRSVDAATLEAGIGMGMTTNQVFWKIRFPIALPVILSGVRTAFVMGVGIAAIAAYIGAGGLGVYIFSGINQVWQTEIEAGALVLAVLALVLDRILSSIQRIALKKGGLR